MYLRWGLLGRPSNKGVVSRGFHGEVSHGDAGREQPAEMHLEEDPLGVLKQRCRLSVAGTE